MWREGVRARVARLPHSAWGPDHCGRVYELCEHIVAEEGLVLDDDVLFAAAWLHDVGTFGEFACEDDAPPVCAARAAERMLGEVEFPAEKIDLTARIIREHSFEGETRDTVEARVLRDADMLEFLGAVGLMRLLSIVELEDWVPDARTALSLALKFAEDLPGKLLHGSAKRLADERVAETMEFIEALSRETAQLQRI